MFADYEEHVQFVLDDYELLVDTAVCMVVYTSAHFAHLPSLSFLSFFFVTHLSVFINRPKYELMILLCMLYEREKEYVVEDLNNCVQ